MTHTKAVDDEQYVTKIIHTHLDLLLDVPESVCSAHVAIFLDTDHI